MVIPEKIIISFDGKKPIENIMPKNKVNYTHKKISIRNAKTAKPGLIDVIHYWEDKMMVSFSTVVMAEIGSYVGDSTEIWAQHCKTVHCIDPWINGYDDTDPSSYVWDMEIIERQFDILVAQYPNIKKHKMVSTEGAALFDDESLDFIYLDGNHLFEFVKMDIKAWLPKLKKPGLFGGHDYQHKWAPEVKPAVIEMFGGIDKHFQDTSWVRWVAK